MKQMPLSQPGGQRQQPQTQAQQFPNTCSGNAVPAATAAAATTASPAAAGNSNSITSGSNSLSSNSNGTTTTATVWQQQQQHAHILALSDKPLGLYDATHGGSLLSSKVLRAIRRRWQPMQQFMPLHPRPWYGLTKDSSLCICKVTLAVSLAPQARPEEANRVPLDSSRVPPDSSKVAREAKMTRMILYPFYRS
jgi:hypothetical protein